VLRLRFPDAPITWDLRVDLKGFADTGKPMPYFDF
jgi:hypothetical protein